MNSTGIVTLYTTLPDRPAAEAMAQTLVSERLAACATVLPTAKSWYRWQGKVETANEVVLLIKTSEGMSDRTMLRIKALHPHEVPAIVQWPIESGHAPYIKWVKDQMS